MPQMRPIHTYSLPIGKNSHVFPKYLIVPKAGPAMVATFRQEIVHRSFRTGYHKQGFASVGIVKGYSFVWVGLDLIDETCLEEVAGWKVEGHRIQHGKM